MALKIVILLALFVSIRECLSQETCCNTEAPCTRSENLNLEFQQNLYTSILEIQSELRALRDDTKLQTQGLNSSIHEVQSELEAIREDIKLQTQGASLLILKNDVSGKASKFFNRSWTEYQNAFGNPASHYWIGLDKLHQLTQTKCMAVFGLQASNGTWYFAQYYNFSVDAPSTNYRLTIGGYSGNAGDGMFYCNGQQFSTYDSEHTAVVKCAGFTGGGFWYGPIPTGDGCGNTRLTSSLSYFHLATLIYIPLNAVEVRLFC